MRSWLPLAIFALIVLAGVIAIHLWQKRSSRPLVRPPPRSQKPDESYQAKNSVASLFLEAVKLKDGSAKWPSVLQALNPQNEPHIRTLLLELRQPEPADALAALEAIEQACIESKREGLNPSRAELLERAKPMLFGKLNRKVT